MFYDDELEACADKLKRESLCNCSRLPNKEFPIIFEGVKGRDMREEKSSEPAVPSARPLGLGLKLYPSNK